MAKSTKKKSSQSCEESLLRARRDRHARQRVKTAGHRKSSRKADESRQNAGPPSKEAIGVSGTILFGNESPRAKTRSFHARSRKKNFCSLRDAMVDSMAGVAQDTLRSRAEGSEASAFGMHQADAGADAYDRDFALSLLSQEQDALYEIDQALKRIELGTYGKCEMSGKPIPHARLEAIPFARFTVECQSQLEKQNKASRVRQSVTSLFGLTDEEGGEGEEEEADAGGSEGVTTNGAGNYHARMHGSEGAGQACFALHDHAEQEKPAHAEPAREKEIQSVFEDGILLHRETK